MKKLIQLALLVSLLMANLTVNAADSTPGIVKEIRRVGSVIIDFEEEIGCNAKKAVVDESDELEKDALSMAMMAMASGYRLKFRYIECKTSPWPHVNSKDIAIVK